MFRNLIISKKKLGWAILIGILVLVCGGIFFVEERQAIQIDPSRKVLLDRIDHFNSGIKPLNVFWDTVSALDTIEYLIKEGPSGWREIIDLYFDPAMNVKSLENLSAIERLNKLYSDYKGRFEIIKKWLMQGNTLKRIDPDHIDECGRNRCFVYKKILGDKNLTLCFWFKKEGWVFIGLDLNE